MAAEKLSISFAPDTIARARRAAEREGLALSTWIDRAARKEADLAEAREALASQFAEYGEPTANDRMWAREQLSGSRRELPELADQAEQRRAALTALDADAEGVSVEGTDGENWKEAR